MSKENKLIFYRFKNPSNSDDSDILLISKEEYESDVDNFNSRGFTEENRLSESVVVTYNDVGNIVNTEVQKEDDVDTTSQKGSKDNGNGQAVKRGRSKKGG